jgi:protein-S-isoprenylcysteine O-methyltransferase Ste14
VTWTMPLVRWLVSTIVLAGIVFLCAGQMNNLMLNIYLAFFAGASLMIVLVADHSLDGERRNPGPGANDSGSRVGASLLFLATVILSALDIGRLHWTHAIDRASQLTALTVLLLAAGLEIWAMAVNPFFSTAIRIQTERNHSVIDRGPYRYIRHPGYLSMVLSMPAAAIVIGSRVALIPAVCYSLLVLPRVAREDEFLRENLPSYLQYAGVVRYRLIPRFW